MRFERARAAVAEGKAHVHDARQRGEAVHARRILGVPRGVAARRALEHGRAEARVTARASLGLG